MKIRIAKVSDAEGIAKVQVDTWKTAYNGIFPDEYLSKLSYNEKILPTKHWLENLEETTNVFVVEAKKIKILDLPQEVYNVRILMITKENCGASIFYKHIREKGLALN